MKTQSTLISVCLLFFVLRLHGVETSTQLLSIPDGPGWGVGLGTGMASMDDHLGWSVQVDATKPISGPVPMNMGIELAYSQLPWSGGLDPYKSFGVNTIEGEGQFLQVSSTFQFLLPIAGVYGFTPYLGVSLGPTVYLARGVSETGDVAHETRVFASALLRPGLRFNGMSFWSFEIEPRFGLLGDRLVFLPRLHVTWEI